MHRRERWIHGFTYASDPVKVLDEGGFIDLDEASRIPDDDGDFLTRTDQPNRKLAAGSINAAVSVAIEGQTPVADAVRLLRKIADWIEDDPDFFMEPLE